MWFMKKSVWLSLVAAALVFGYFFLPLVLVYKPVTFNNGLLWLVSASSIACLLIFWREKTGDKLILASVLALVFVTFNLLLTFSFLTQGTPFNHAFVAHLDVSTVAIAWQTDAAGFGFAIAYLLASPFVGYFVAKAEFEFTRWRILSPSWLSIAFFCAAVGTNYPLHSAIQHVGNTNRASAAIAQSLVAIQDRQVSEKVVAGNLKNIVLIYLESVEQNYLENAIFEGLTPFIDRFRQESLVFTGIEQFPGTGWTIGGMVSSQCGVPLLAGSKGNSILNEVENPFEKIKCLAEYLSDVGYNSAYIGGATLDFAGKGNFLRDNGFAVALGSDELSDGGSNKWGMYDVDMYRHAKKIFDGLDKGEKPYILSLLTLDTHHPFGTPSPGCTPYQDSDVPMLSAVHCADQLLEDFVAHVRSSQNQRETVLAIMSDHLLIFGEIEPELEKQERLITLMIHDPSSKGRRFDKPGTHFDVAPTLLELAGIAGTEFAFGQSLISNEAGRVFEENFTEADFEAFSILQLTSQ